MRPRDSGEGTLELGSLDLGDVDERIATVDQRRLRPADDDPGAIRSHQPQAATEGVRQATQSLVVLDDLPQLRLHLEDPGAAGAHPTRATAYQGWRLGHVDNGVDHAEVRQHPQDPTDAGVDRVLVEPPCLSPFVEEDASATFAGGRKLKDGDRLLCFGRLEEMRDLIPQRKKRRTRVRKLPKVPIHES